MNDACQIANWFVRRVKQEYRVLSTMSILKLACIAHEWHGRCKNHHIVLKQD